MHILALLIEMTLVGFFVFASSVCLTIMFLMIPWLAVVILFCVAITLLNPIAP